MVEELYSVCVFYEPGNLYEYKCKHALIGHALAEVVIQSGRSDVIRLIVTNTADFIVFDWRADSGIVWPMMEDKLQKGEDTDVD